MDIYTSGNEGWREAARCLAAFLPRAASVYSFARVNSILISVYAKISWIWARECSAFVLFARERGEGSWCTLIFPLTSSLSLCNNVVGLFHTARISKFLVSLFLSTARVARIEILGGGER